MNWKQILKTDLGTLMRRFVPPHLFYELRGRVWPGPIYLFKSPWRTDLQTVTTQVHAIVRCNAPLVQGTEHAAWDAPSRKSRLILQALHDDSASGLMLHEAMARRSRFFPAYYVDLIKAGEMTGKLREAFERIQQHLAAERKRWFTIYGWVSYLSVVALLQFLVVLFLLTYVFPIFVEILGDVGRSTPPIYAPLNHVGTAVSFWFAPLPILLVIAALLFPRELLPFRRHAGDSHSSLWRTIGTFVPGLGRLLIKNDLTHCAAVLQRLLSAGIPMNEALDDCAALGLSSRIVKALRRVKRRVEEGNSLAGAMAEEPVIPESFRTQVSIGETSGQLPAALERISDLYQLQTEKTFRMILNVVGPLGVIALGLVVLTIEASMFEMMRGYADGIMTSM